MLHGEACLLVQPSAKLMCDPMAGFDPLTHREQFKVSIAKLNPKVSYLTNKLNQIAPLCGGYTQKHALLGLSEIPLEDDGCFWTQKLEHGDRFGHVETQACFL